jgi:hypothetical protein
MSLLVIMKSKRVLQLFCHILVHRKKGPDSRYAKVVVYQGSGHLFKGMFEIHFLTEFL